MATRWDRLLESKPIPLLEHLLEEVAKLVAKDLSAWPPKVIELDPTTGASFAALLEPGRPKPAPAVYREAFCLARLELGREFEAFDDYMRNERWREAGLSAADKPALHFLTRWLVEQLLALNEATEGRVKRPLLIDCLGRIERRTLPSA